MQTFRFRNLQTIEDRDFNAPDMLSAIQQAAAYWGWERPTDWQLSDSGRLTLLSNSPSGNVIATIFYYR
jgi:hypothetical protein